MTLEEIKEEKRTIENKIEILIMELVNKTGITIEDVKFFSFEGDANITIKAIIQ